MYRPSDQEGRLCERKVRKAAKRGRWDRRSGEPSRTRPRHRANTSSPRKASASCLFAAAQRRRAAIRHSACWAASSKGKLSKNERSDVHIVYVQSLHVKQLFSAV